METTTSTTFHCADCKHDKSIKTHGGTGYAEAYGQAGVLICYDCVAVRDAATMRETGHSQNLPLYWSGGRVSNWPGTLTFTPRHSKTRKVFSPVGGIIPRTDVWFTGPDGKKWHGVQRGNWNDICRCRRLKD